MTDMPDTGVFNDRYARYRCIQLQICQIQVSSMTDMPDTGVFNERYAKCWLISNIYARYAQ